METSRLPIGVFDSGIGGLTVMRAIQERLPHESVVYFGDRARCPYGDRQPEEVIRFSEEIADYLFASGIKLLVVACNTATAVALHNLQERLPIPVVGVIAPGALSAVRATRNRRIGVIGTSVTVSSHAYRKAICTIAPDIVVHELACPLFVPLVERGQLDGDHVEAVVRQSLKPLAGSDIDSLVLGCTHYPLLAPIIRRVMGAAVQVISSADATAAHVARLLAERNLRNTDSAKPMYRYLTSGDSASLKVALANWFAEPVVAAAVEHVDAPLVVTIERMVNP
ncbi:glutamate racemase 1 [Alicyclobacillus hesperidum subsp. aegles]|uniref:Glutamate racemase n=1 Tax=Alicyclobacillus hesperidum TaxID=89784 RepID=A0A1H2T9Y7_9BACL|nr:glutamate racemase [Alicyclobacillus hesperidum]GLG00901.1 glutamate racemase 1 [Alicyclobacillus hesperidum subsp. aegles]GLV13821.1 glutamate racemase 1 [Alicyclobacillus hesperidum]SDW40766.1 glutamate racemase [Alicyclobacillus hesperidum]